MQQLSGKLLLMDSHLIFYCHIVLLITNVICLVSLLGLVVAGTVFLLAQLAVIGIWTYVYQRRRKVQAYNNEIISNASNYGSQNGSSSSVVLGNMANSSRSESLCKLYDAGYRQRHVRPF